MKNIPKTLVFMAIIYISIAIAMPLQIMYLYGHHANEINMIFSKLSVFNLLTIILSLISSFYIITGNKRALTTICLIFPLIVYTHYVQLMIGDDWDNKTIYFTTALYFAFFTFTFNKNIIRVFNNPNLHWWKVPKRVQKAIPIWIKTSEGLQLFGKTFDISSSGAFINTFNIKLAKGSEFNLYFKNNSELVEVPIEVIRSMEIESGKYPKGFGVKFKFNNFFKRIFITQSLLAIK